MRSRRFVGSSSSSSLSIVTDELQKAVTSLEESLQLYSKSAPGSAESKAFRDACIQRFEYSIEFAWKVSMKLLGSQTAAAKPAIREMARNNLIASPAMWFEFIEARHHSAHSYDDEIAKKVFTQIQLFLPECHLAFWRN
jgi:nucleotidyltransferase substrate binding protein (TIGR01987 family)